MPDGCHTTGGYTEKRSQDPGCTSKSASKLPVLSKYSPGPGRQPYSMGPFKEENAGEARLWPPSLLASKADDQWSCGMTQPASAHFTSIMAPHGKLYRGETRLPRTFTLRNTISAYSCGNKRFYRPPRPNHSFCCAQVALVHPGHRSPNCVLTGPFPEL